MIKWVTRHIEGASLLPMRFLIDTATGETLDCECSVKVNDHFNRPAIDSTNLWTVAGVNGGTAAYYAAAGGYMRITTGGADDDDVDVAGAVCWQVDASLIMEARIAINDVTHGALFVGFSDATGEAADHLAIDFTGNSLATEAKDAVGLLWDPDSTTTPHIQFCSVAGDADGTPGNTSIDPVAATFKIFRIECDQDGNARAYIDGALKASLTAAVTPTTLLCPYIGVMNRGEGAANTWDVDYVRVWSNVTLT